MSKEEGFLTRWSRRKRGAAASRVPTAAPQPASKNEPDNAERVPAERQPDTAPDTIEPTTAAEIAAPIDIGKLPPIESITAATDIRPFLAPGVPPALARAALRRAWSVDPNIRDFIGIAENQWDFTASQGTPGFGPLQVSDDLRRLIEQMVGDPSSPSVRSESAGEPEIKELSSNPNATASRPEVESRPSQQEKQPLLAPPSLLQDSKKDASQHDRPKGTARKAGRALPR